jgi:hypothetical protein
MTTKKDPKEVLTREEVIAEIKTSLSKGHHAKVVKLVKGLPDDDPLKIEALEKAAEVKAKAAKEAAEKKAKKVKKAPKKASIPMNAKMASPEAILKSYDGLIEQLSKAEVSQREKGKPSKIYFIHKLKIQAMKMNFIKSMR